MRMKTSELSGAALDWAVAMIEQESDNKLTITRREDYTGWPIVREVSSGSAPEYERWSPARIWSQGGPIIERERLYVMAPIIHRISKERHALPVNDWRSMRQMPDETVIHGRGPTGLIAAMRCYVASKLGEYVDVPDEVQS